MSTQLQTKILRDIERSNQLKSSTEQTKTYWLGFLDGLGYAKFDKIPIEEVARLKKMARANKKLDMSFHA